MGAERGDAVMMKAGTFTCFIVLAWLTLNGATVGPTLAQPTDAAKPFLVFDGTSYHGKPDMAQYGLTPINILYVSRFGETWYKGPAKDQLPDEKTVRRVAQEAAAQGNLAVIDIEHWVLRGDDTTVAQNVDKYLRVAEWFHQEVPSLKVGYFGILPVAAYGWALKGSASLEYKQWQAENDRLRLLANSMDAIFPSIYTYYPDQQAWVQFAIENIKEARRYGKPVYVFLWPQYTDTAKQHALEFIPADYWRLQLETVRQYADGLVIWGGWGDNRPANWDENAAWWKITKEFMKSRDQSLPVAPNSLTIH
jgi:hypothetical protein